MLRLQVGDRIGPFVRVVGHYLGHRSIARSNHDLDLARCIVLKQPEGALAGGLAHIHVLIQHNTIDGRNDAGFGEIGLTDQKISRSDADIGRSDT
ncbi:hypothetical protein [Roseovarius arcticus]|uniref:hypothetical protein n=1 Tax=Roseovarius arcticus TaxID=2547404 RepID=UPI0011102B28|nr:hypothetical protein [Roseovarius arcticus]